MNIIINNSRILASIFFTLHVLALISVAISELHWAFKIILLFIIVMNLVRQARLHLFRLHPGSITQINLSERGQINIKKAGSSDWMPTEIESTVIWSWILMLKLKELSPDARSLKLLIAVDAVSKEEFRQISVWANQMMPAEAKN